MRGRSDSIQALTTASNADILSPHCSLSKPLNLYTLISFQMSQNSSSRCATHTQRQFFRSQTLLYHPHPHFSIFSLVHLHLTFSGLVCILALRGRQEPCPFTTRLRVLKLVSNTEHVTGSTHSLDQPFFTMLLELVAQMPYIDLEDIRPAFKIHAPDAIHQE